MTEQTTHQKATYELGGNHSFLDPLKFVGNIGYISELRTLPSGVPVKTINVGVTRYWPGKDNTVNEQQYWIRADITNGMTEKPCSVGDLVLVVGVLKADPEGNPVIFTNPADGFAASRFEVWAQTFAVLARKVQHPVAETKPQAKPQAAKPQAKPKAGTKPAQPAQAGEDFPF